MATKQAILDNVQLYSAEDLYHFILDGTVTFEELRDETDGNFPPRLRTQIERMLKGGEEEEWNEALMRNEEAGYQRFISTHPESVHCEEARRRIMALQVQVPPAPQPGFGWGTLDKTSKQALIDFIENNPSDSHIFEARAILNKMILDEIDVYDPSMLVKEIHQIETDRLITEKSEPIVSLIKQRVQENKVSREEVLDLIREDHNILSSSVVYKLITDGFLGYDELLRIGIRVEFIKKLIDQQKSETLPFSREIARINKVSTEIYFWGIPSSGKTCALGGILNVAGNGRIALSMIKDPDCQGYGYMTRLPQLFNTAGVSVLPEGTPVYATYEMGFDLEDQKNNIHPITCIDLAGELVRCMYKSSAGDMLSDEEELALDTLTRILIDNRSVNRKVHFFVVEYGGEKRLYDGLEQSVYLDSALRYIERTRIFENDTDAVYLLITKVDMIGKQGAELQNALKEYILNTHYRGFYQGLEQICRKNQINGGEVEILPFSLGDVCFQNYCLFNEHPSENVVQKILDRSKGFSQNRFINSIKK